MHLFNWLFLIICPQRSIHLNDMLNERKYDVQTTDAFLFTYTYLRLHILRLTNTYFFLQQ